MFNNAASRSNSTPKDCDSGNTPHPTDNSQQNCTDKIPSYRPPNVKSFDIGNIPIDNYSEFLFNLSKDKESSHKNGIQKTQLNNNNSTFLCKKRNAGHSLEEEPYAQECNTPCDNDNSTMLFNETNMNKINNVSNKEDTTTPNDHETLIHNETLPNKSNDTTDDSSGNDISTNNEKYKKVYDNYAQGKSVVAYDVHNVTELDKVILVYEKNVWSFDGKVNLMEYIKKYIKGIKNFAVGDNKKDTFVYLDSLSPFSYTNELRKNLTYNDITPFLYLCDDHNILYTFCEMKSPYYTNMEYYIDVNSKIENNSFHSSAVEKKEQINNKNVNEKAAGFVSKNPFKSRKDVINNNQAKNTFYNQIQCLYIKESYKGLALECIRKVFGDSYFIKDINDNFWGGYDKPVDCLVIINTPENDTLNANQLANLKMWCTGKLSNCLKLDKNGEFCGVKPKYYLVIVIGKKKFNDLYPHPLYLTELDPLFQKEKVEDNQESMDHLVALLFGMKQWN